MNKTKFTLDEVKDYVNSLNFHTYSKVMCTAISTARQNNTLIVGVKTNEGIYITVEPAFISISIPDLVDKKLAFWICDCFSFEELATFLKLRFRGIENTIIKEKDQTIHYDNIYISIAKDFSESPGPRKKYEGKFSGEEFREKILYPKLKDAIKNNVKVIIDLDGTYGYSLSFFEESFGGLINYHNLNFNVIHDHIIPMTTEDNSWIDSIWASIKPKNTICNPDMEGFSKFINKLIKDQTEESINEWMKSHKNSCNNVKTSEDDFGKCLLLNIIHNIK